MADIKWSAFPDGAAITSGDEVVGLRAGANVRLTANTFDNLNLDTNTISSVDTDGDINITPDGSGNMVVSSNISLSDTKGIIDENGNSQLLFNTTASAVNYVDLTNAATGSGPLLQAAGSDANIDLRIQAKGTGNVLFDGSDVICGDPGTEASGINVGGVTYNSNVKSSEIGATNLAQFIMHRHSTTASPIMLSAHSNSDTSAHGVVTNGMNLFSNYTAGWTGTSYSLFGGSFFDVDSTGTVSTTSAPGRWRVQVTPDGSLVPATAITVTNDKTATFAGAISAASLSLTSPLPVTSGGTGLSSTTANQLLYSSTTSTITGLATANNGILSTNGSGVPAINNTVDLVGQLNVDNLRIDGNILSSTNTNGAINLTPNGTGNILSPRNVNASVGFTSSNVFNGTSARAYVSASNSATPGSGIVLQAPSPGYTGVAGWADSGILSVGSELSNGMKIASATQGIKLYSSSLVTPVLTLDTSTNATFGGLVTTTTGINFGDETLSDYDEGTFTPTVTFATPGDLAVAYTSQLGSYTRVGNIVHVTVLLICTPTFSTSSGTLRFDGLPFAGGFSNTQVIAAQGLGSGVAWGAGKTAIVAGVVSGQTYLEIQAIGSSTGSANLSSSNVTSAVQMVLRFNGTYEV